MKYLVQVQNGGAMYWLRSTVWTSEIQRATTHDTREAAEASLAKAKQFMAAKIFKAARVVELAQ